MKKVNYLFLILILLLAFLLGSRMILSGDFFFLYDQARDYLLAKDVVENHTLMLIGNRSGLGGFFHGPAWIYFLAPIYILAKGDPLGLAYFYIFLQLFTVLTAYVIGQKLYSVKAGRIIALLFAVSPAVWAPVPNTVSADIEPLIYLFIFYFLIRFLRGDSKSFIFASFFTGFALQFETASSLVLIPSVMIVFALNRSALFKNLKIFALGLFAFILSVSSFIIFDLRHQFLMTKSVLGAVGGGPREKGYLEWAERIPAHLNSLVGVYKNILFTETSILSLLMATILIYGVILINYDKKIKYKKEFFTLILFTFLFFGLLMFYPYRVWPEYTFGLLAPVAIIFYLSLSVIWKHKTGKVLTILFFSISIIYILSSLKNQYFQKYKYLNSSGSYINQRNVVDWIYQDKKTGTFGYFVYTTEIFTHGADYMISWRGKNYPKVIAQNTKQKTTYLILYPHLENDERAYDFWKKNIIRTSGKVVSKKVFKGNITVEKLSIEGKEPEVDPNYYQGLLFR